MPRVYHIGRASNLRDDRSFTVGDAKISLSSSSGRLGGKPSDMTLCVAWKWQDQHGSTVCFAADTCITLGEHRMPHGGIKVFELPVRYSSPNFQNGQPGAWSTTYGMAFSGSYLTAFLLKEMLADVLARLQGIGGLPDASFDNVCNLVANFYRHYCGEIGNVLRATDTLSFFLGGFCPVANRVRAARFGLADSGNVSWTEVLTPIGESWESLGTGSARERFDSLLKLNLSAPPCRVHFAMFRRLRDVIVDSEDRTVGGVIQYGAFNNQGQFQLSGTGMLTLGEIGPEMTQYFRGTDISQVHQPNVLGGFHIAYPTSLPFDEDIQAFDAGGAFWSTDGKRAMLDELITVLPHDPRWASRYMRERYGIRLVRAVRSVTHIGSTAVRGLPAIPCIDILVGVDALPDLRQSPVDFSGSGYEYLGPGMAGECRVFRRKGKPGIRLRCRGAGRKFFPAVDPAPRLSAGAS